MMTVAALAAALAGAMPGAALHAQEASPSPAGTSSAAPRTAADTVLLGARTVSTIVGRMRGPVHSGTLAAEEGSGADALFHRLEGDATGLEDSARALEAAASDPDEARRLLVDELFPGIQGFASQAFAMREALAAEDPELEAVQSMTATLDALDLEVAGLQDAITAAAAAVQEPQIAARGGIGGPLNPKLLPSGNVLVALSLDDKVVELTPTGDVAWEHAVAYPTDVERLDNGNTLIASRDEGRVVEIDTTGAEVWTYAGEAIYGVDQLPNGNRLITIQGDPARIVEVDTSGAEVWSYGGGSPSLLAPSAQRLPNGNTIIGDNSGYMDGTATVTEVNPDGEVVWTYDDGIWGIYGVARLETGNTLINDQGNGRIIEVTPDGTIAWRHGAMSYPGGFDLAEDGRMAIAVFGENRLFEIDRSTD